MPLDELSPAQEKFIRDHFNTSIFRSKSKDELMNEAYEKAATAVFREINRIGSLIDGVEKAYDHAPIFMYRGELQVCDLAAHEAIKGAKKDIKKGRAPDFTAVYGRLTELEKRINLRLDQMRAGKGVDADAGVKQDFGEKTIAALNKEMSDAEILIGRVMREMPPSPQEAYTKRGAAIRAYRTLYAEALDSIGKRATELTENKTITLDACKIALNGMLAGFLQSAKTQTDILKDLLTAKPLDYSAERQKLDTDPKYTSQDVVVRSRQRGEGAAAEVKKLDDSIKKQLLKLEQLKKEFAEARNEDRSKAKAAFTNAKNQLATLQSRQQQLATFVADGEKRDRTLIEATMRTENLLGFTLELNEAMKEDHASGVDELNELVAALKEPSRGFVVPTNAQDVTDKIAAMREEIAASAKREVVLPKLDRKEPKLFELAANEAAALNGLLDVAAKCAANGKFDMAAALIEQVNDNKRAFLTARQALMLPVPLPPVPDDGKAFDLRAAGIQSRLRDLIAVGAVSSGGKDAATLLAEVKKLATDTRAEIKQGLAVDFAAKNRLLDAMRPDIEKLAPPPPSQALTDAREKAKSTGKDVEQLLGKLLKTRKITKDDIIEVPNRVYTKEEQENLVRLDEIIEVMVDGKVEQHTIIQRRKGKGGQDISVRKDQDQRLLGTRLHIEDKRIPIEATDALRRKAITLGMMGEVDSPESAEAMEAYRLEVEALAKDIGDNGETKYPKVEEIIEDCTEKFKTGDLSEYIPANFATVKAAFEKFVGEWKKKGPSEALTAAEKHQAAILVLEKAAGTLKANYQKFKDVCQGILKDLEGRKNKSETSDPLGKLMKATLKKTPDELFAGLELPVDDPLIPQIAAARTKFENIKKFYAANSDKGLKSDTMAGAWKTKAETAMTKLKTKEAGNIDEAIKDLADITDGMHKFSKDMDGLDTAKGEDLAKLLLALVEKLHASATQEDRDAKDNVDYFALKKSIKEKISNTIKAARDKGSNPVAKLLLDQAKGIDKQRKVTSAETEADCTWRLGLGSLERLEREIDGIMDRLRDTSKEKGEKIKKMRIGSKPAVLEKTINDLKASAKDMVAKLVRPSIPTGDPDGLTAHVDALEKNLSAIALPDLGTLKKIAADIDKANDLAEKGGKTKDERIEAREKALAEIRKIRNVLENHPAIKLYRTNPFDGGTGVRLVQTVLHQVEIAVLGCVSPLEKA